jgi:hypothetical protein
VRRVLAGGTLAETRLEAAGPEGTYRGPLPAAAPDSNGLSMRISIGGTSHEVPLAD